MRFERKDMRPLEAARKHHGEKSDMRPHVVNAPGVRQFLRQLLDRRLKAQLKRSEPIRFLAVPKLRINFQAPQDSTADPHPARIPWEQVGQEKSGSAPEEIERWIPVESARDGRLLL